MALRGYIPKTKKAPWFLAQPKQAAKPQRRIKPVSKKLGKAKREYHKLRDEWLALPENKWCEACILTGRGNYSDTQGRSGVISYRASEVHHTHGRVGRLLNYTPWWLAVCPGCHYWIHEHPAEARRLGLLCPVGEWNTQPKE